MKQDFVTYCNTKFIAHLHGYTVHQQY